MPGSTQNVALTGTGIAMPSAGLSTTRLTFPRTNVGVTAAIQTVTISNSGTGPLTIASITIGGNSSSGDFTESNTCGSTLESGSICSVTVTFKPSASGSRTGTLTITDNAGNVSGSTQTVSLSGTGVGVPAAAVAPASLTFTDQSIGSTSAAQTIILSNAGTSALTIASIAITGANFSSSNNCAGSVAAGSSCTVSVTFTPTSSGNLTATMTVTDNAGNNAGSTQTVALAGTGVAVATASVSPSTISFPNTLLGSSSSANVTVANTGTGTLSISNILISTGNTADFSKTTTCGATLAPSASCTVSVTFTPGAAGSGSSALYIADNSGNGSSQTVTLIGTGVTPAPLGGLAPSSVAFTSQFVATTSSPTIVTLSNMLALI